MREDKNSNQACNMEEKEQEQSFINTPLQEENNALQEKIRSLEEELQKSKDKYLTCLAETENERRRIQKDNALSAKRVIEKSLLEFLSPIDNFEKALSLAETMSEEVKNWGIGFQMILNQLKEALESNNITSYTSVGKQFDPYLHEAVETEEREDVEEGIILEEFVKGYQCDNRILRPAQVKVAKRPSKNLEENK